jgi:gas vesicle protein
MRSTRDFLITATIAFAGGFAAGFMYQTPSAQRVRGSIATTARSQVQWLENRLAGLENQIHQLEDQLSQAGVDIGQRLKDTVGQYHPGVEPEPWDVEEREVERELRRIPRR